MAKFIKAEADNCKTIRCDAILADNVYKYHIITVEDDTGRTYTWDEKSLSETPTRDAVKQAIIDYLMGIEKLPAPVIISEVKDDSVGKKVSDI